MQQVSNDHSGHDGHGAHGGHGGHGGAITVGPKDPRFDDLATGANQRWTSRPEYVRLVSSARQVVDAVEDAVRADVPVSVRSGGHCYEGLVDGQVIIDMSLMKQVYYDSRHRAFVVEPGALLGDVYATLYKGWGVTLPGGSCPSVGVGGHALGGGYGLLSRRHGLVIDHLYAIEVVVVDRHRRVRTVFATREASDPNRDLFWAHTGGGGGNFGCVVRYWFRSPKATGHDPSEQLPHPPSRVLISTVTWAWQDLPPAAFAGLVRNFGAWHEANDADGSPNADLFSQLEPAPLAAGTVTMHTQVDATAPDAVARLDRFVRAVNEGVGVPFREERQELGWLHSTQWNGFNGPEQPTMRFKAKVAQMRRGWTDEQIAAMYHHLTQVNYQNPGARIMFISFGGRINAVDPHATAYPHRDSVMLAHLVSMWTDAGQDEQHVSWVRNFFHDLFAATDGVPVVNEQTDGSYINYPDLDLLDNSAKVPWHDLYYKDNYPRLQRIRARWNPLGVFGHEMSIALPD
ncbi:FAD-binding oxidoreductase [Streptomyces piniterrae]|uniref:FAD-binding oxidoreductase n=1 Tax=Streptomyces piniterrae TaxID=2571125 RepID=A0A4U0NVI4_9ACTN|nr:FAD-binding protein [Streptomyces piniterrae]TJZ54254.1 FAD-binding oxidoreductase [Streptomyces piniterrae]